VWLRVGDGVLLRVGDGVLLQVGDGVLLQVGDGVLLRVGDGVLLRVGDGDLLLVGDGMHLYGERLNAVSRQVLYVHVSEYVELIVNSVPPDGSLTFTYRSAQYLSSSASEL
jgi:hypothetical protein